MTLSFEVSGPAESVWRCRCQDGGEQWNNNTFLFASSQTEGDSLQPPQCNSQTLNISNPAQQLCFFFPPHSTTNLTERYPRPQCIQLNNVHSPMLGSTGVCVCLLGKGPIGDKYNEDINVVFPTLIHSSSRKKCFLQCACNRLWNVIDWLISTYRCATND